MKATLFALRFNELLGGAFDVIPYRVPSFRSRAWKTLSRDRRKHAMQIVISGRPGQ
jgi:hypothetical protein